MVLQELIERIDAESAAECRLRRRALTILGLGGERLREVLVEDFESLLLFDQDPTHWQLQLRYESARKLANDALEKVTSFHA